MTEYEMRRQVVEFAATYPTPNVRRAVELAAAGRITWGQVYELFRGSLAAALVEVSQ